VAVAVRPIQGSDTDGTWHPPDGPRARGRPDLPGGAILGLVAGLVAGGVALLWSFFFGPLVLHVDAWLVSPDVWWTARAAGAVAVGDLAHVETAGGYVGALPGFEILLAPVAWLGHRLGLVAGRPFPLARPSLWLADGPVFFALSATAPAGVGALGAVVGLGRRHRRALVAWTAVVAAFLVVLLGGHPEDAMALGLASLSLALLLSGRPGAAGWTLAGAIVFQDWAGLLLPLVVAASPPGRRVDTLLRAAGAPAALGLLLFGFDPAAAWRWLVVQPQLHVEQRTPWWSVARHVRILASGEFVTAGGHPAVLAGPDRSLAVLLAIGVALWVARRPDTGTMLTAATLVLFGRDAVEATLFPYYVVPASTFLVLLALRARRPSRCIIGLVVATALPLLVIARLPPLAYWAGLVIGATATTLALRADGSQELLSRPPAPRPAPTVPASDGEDGAPASSRLTPECTSGQPRGGQPRGGQPRGGWPGPGGSGPTVRVAERLSRLSVLGIGLRWDGEGVARPRPPD